MPCELEKTGLDPEEMGILDIPVTYPSGAAIVVIRKEELADFRKYLEGIGLKEKAVSARPYEFKIHGIPDRATEVNVALAIENRTGLRPSSTQLSKYKTKDLQVANCACTEELYAALENVHTIFIHFKRCYIDTTPNLLSCKKCSALGHTGAHCPHSEETAKQMQEDRGLQPFCPPCILWLAFSALAQIVRRLRSPISFPLCHG